MSGSSSREGPWPLFAPSTETVNGVPPVRVSGDLRHAERLTVALAADTIAGPPAT